MENKTTLSIDLATGIGVDVNHCYQCGKCTAGCVLAGDMDIPPSFIMRLLQTGTKANDKRVLNSNAIWLCLSCENCVARCPMEIDLPSVMDYLRERSRKEGCINEKARQIVAFHKSFLDCVKRTGRLYEIGLVAEYKMRTMKLLQDVDIAPVMMAKGKLNLIPEHLKNNTDKIGRIFSNTIDKK